MEILGRNKKKEHNATGTDLLSGILGPNGIKTDVAVDIPPITIALVVAGIAVAIGLGVIVFHYTKQAVS